MNPLWEEQVGSFRESLPCTIFELYEKKEIKGHLIMRNNTTTLKSSFFGNLFLLVKLYIEVGSLPFFFFCSISIKLYCKEALK